MSETIQKKFPTSWWGAFWLGTRSFPPVPAFTVFCTSIGFGALAKSAGLDIFATLFISPAIFALPAQVVFADEWARGTSWAAIALAVTLTGVRLFPMTVEILPALRDKDDSAPRGISFQAFLAAHFIAVTSWIEHRRLLPLGGAHKTAFFIGIGTTLCATTTAGGGAGFLISADVGVLGGAALLFTTPLYFFLSMLAGAKVSADWLAVLAGAIMGPVLFEFVPNLALLMTGIFGGTFAFLVGRAIDRHRSGDGEQR